ncbi:MAG: HTH-type transcriptional activator RhaS [bacterium ADurb.Bin429]|nr:MAG: HTH-type transcriptional activator RhaS [bacterium ADurb.Bin429]
MTEAGNNPQRHMPYWMDATEPVEASLATTVAMLPIGQWRVRLCDFKEITLDAGWSSGIHRHRYCEVDLLLVGHGATASMPLQPITPGTILFHAPDTLHAWQASPGHCCRVLSLGFWTEPELDVIHPRRWPVLPELLTEAALLMQDIQHAQPGWDTRLPLRLGLMLARLLPIMAGDTLPVGRRAYPAACLTALDEFLHAHLHEPLSLDTIAEHLCLSRRTLTRIVRSYTGSSVMQRLQTFRLLHAAELLARTDWSLTKISERAGIPQLSYFCRCFRRHFGCSPTAYRRQLEHTPSL